MAIQSEYSAFGHSFPSAYTRIDQDGIVIGHDRITITTKTWANQGAAQKALSPSPEDPSELAWDGFSTNAPSIGGDTAQFTGAEFQSLYTFQVQGGSGLGDNIRAQAYRLLLESGLFHNPQSV